MFPQLALHIAFAIWLLQFVPLAIAKLPHNTRGGSRDRVTMKMLQERGKEYVMVLSVEETIIATYPPKNGICTEPSFPIKNKKAKVINCAIIRPGFVYSINALKTKFLFILYSDTGKEYVGPVAETLQGLFDDVEFEVRYKKHMHVFEYGMAINGITGSKDIRNIVDDSVFEVSVIVELKPEWYKYLNTEESNQIARLIQVSKFRPTRKEYEKEMTVDYQDNNLQQVVQILKPLFSTELVNDQPRSIRTLLDARRVANKGPLVVMYCANSQQ